MIKNTRYKHGFTIVEIILAMTFLSVLLITITFLTIHITSVYQKGLSIKAVTTTGQQLVDEFSRAISSSTGLPVTSFCNRYPNDSTARQKCTDDTATKFLYQVRYASASALSIPQLDDDDAMVPVSGVFCSGRYSYLWNSGYVLNNSFPQANQYTAIMETENGTIENFRLLKIVDLDRSMCTAHLRNDVYAYDNMTANTNDDNRKYSSPSVGTIEEVLTNSEDNLALYTFDIFQPSVHSLTNHAFYSGTFILATIQGGIDITAQGDFCKDAASIDLDTDFNYCAINKFNFAMRATGETKQ